MDLGVFESSIESIRSLIQEYRSLEHSSIGTGIQRLKIC